MLQQMFKVTATHFHSATTKTFCATNQQCRRRYSAADQTTRESVIC